MFKKTLCLSGLVLLLFLADHPVVFSEEDHERAKMLRDAGVIVPLVEILEQTTQEQQGKMIDLELKEEGGRIVYALAFLDEQGQVWEIKYDAKSGDKISSAQER